MSQNGVVWDDASFEQMKQRMNEYAKFVLQQVQRYAHHIAIEMENWAKDNHDWQNRTGLAEKGLRGYVEKKGETFRIILTHSVEYGLILETKDGGRWGVIWKTIQHFIPIVQRDMDYLKSRLP